MLGLWLTAGPHRYQAWANCITIVLVWSAEVIVHHINKLSFLPAQQKCQSWSFHAAAGDRQLLNAVHNKKNLNVAELKRFTRFGTVVNTFALIHGPKKLNSSSPNGFCECDETVSPGGFKGGFCTTDLQILSHQGAYFYQAMRCIIPCKSILVITANWMTTIVKKTDSLPAFFIFTKRNHLNWHSYLYNCTDYIIQLALFLAKRHQTYYYSRSFYIFIKDIVIKPPLFLIGNTKQRKISTASMCAYM